MEVRESSSRTGTREWNREATGGGGGVVVGMGVGAGGVILGMFVLLICCGTNVVVGLGAGDVSVGCWGLFLGIKMP